MPRWVSLFLAYIITNVIYYSFFNPLPFPSIKAFFYTFIGDQIAVMTTSPLFWAILALSYFTLRAKWIFIKEPAK